MTPKDLLLNSEISSRYHLSRAQHFAARASWISIITIFAGTGVVAGAIKTNADVSLILGIVIAFLNTVRMVTKPAEQSGEHLRLGKAWSAIRGELEADSAPAEEQWKQLLKQANELEGQCMEDMRALKYYCTNDALGALGRSAKRYEINLVQKWTKHLFKHTHGFDRQNEAFEKARRKRERKRKKLAEEAGRQAAELVRAGRAQRPPSGPPDRKITPRDDLPRGNVGAGAEMGTPA